MSDQASEKFPPDVQAIIDAGLEFHRALPEAQEEVDRLLSLRRAQVLKARARGVSGYSLARIFEVSQTTISNWSQDKD